MTKIIYITFRSLTHMKFGFDWLSGFKVEDVLKKNIEGRRTDDDDGS